MEAQPEAKYASWTIHRGGAGGSRWKTGVHAASASTRLLRGPPHAPRCPIPWRLAAAPASGPAPARPDSAVPLQPLLSLDHWVTTRFAGAGDARVTVQAACGSSVLQDSKVVRVLGESPGGRAACQGSQPHAPVLGGPGPHRRRPQSTPKEGPPPSGLRPHRRSDNHSFCFEDGPPWGQRLAVRQAVGPPPAAPHPQP